MPIRSVNLDEETIAISKKVGNFSEFTRECLRRWNAHTMGNVHIQQIRVPESKKCVPWLNAGMCLTCWPDGAPSKEDWKYYVELVKQLPTSANELIEEKARELNKHRMFEIPKEKVL